MIEGGYAQLMNLECLELQDFDARAFGAPFFRVKTFDAAGLDRDLEAVAGLSRRIIDAAVIAGDRGWDRFFQERGFKKACVQVRFVCEPAACDAGVEPGETAEGRLSEADIERHVQNLEYDRFNLDAAIRKKDRDRFQSMWMRNSMRSEAILKLYDRASFVSFKVGGEILNVDVFSVLDRRQGVGSALLARLKAYACRNRLKQIQVTTECENLPACLFYQKNGFRIGAFTSRFHLVHY